MKMFVLGLSYPHLSCYFCFSRLIYLAMVLVGQFIVNAWPVDAQGLSRYNKKGNIFNGVCLIITDKCYIFWYIICIWIAYAHKFSINLSTEVDLGQLEVIQRVTTIKTAELSCDVRCCAACEKTSGRNRVIVHGLADFICVNN